jgi:hypothetical protein
MTKENLNLINIAVISVLYQNHLTSNHLFGFLIIMKKPLAGVAHGSSDMLWLFTKPTIITKNTVYLQEIVKKSILLKYIVIKKQVRWVTLTGISFLMDERNTCAWSRRFPE